MSKFNIDDYPELKDELRRRDLSEIRELRKELATAIDQIDTIATKRPSQDDLVHLARTNPAEFNRLYESGEINDAFATTRKDKDTK